MGMTMWEWKGLGILETSPAHLYSIMKYTMAVRVHPRSLILVPIEKHVYNFLLAININLGRILFRFRYYRFSPEYSHPNLFYAKFVDVPGLDCRSWSSEYQRLWGNIIRMTTLK